MFKKTSLVTGIAACAALALTMSPNHADAVDYAAMTPQELAEHLIFNTNSYEMDRAVQEGGTAIQRMTQDDLQKACSIVGGGKPDGATLAALSADARSSITYPEGGIVLGDWKKGRELSWSGFGYRVGHSDDNHTGNRVPGGNCYNCHQMATDRDGGTIGPSLTGYGKMRGTSDAMLKYVYEIIYNAHAYFPCTNMPRMGQSMSSQQIADIMAYVLDPESPVNQ